MNALTKTGALVSLSVAVLATGHARAMEIRDFYKMAIQDRAEFTAVLVGAAEKAFKDEGRSDLAAQVDKLFTTTLPGDAHTIGSVELVKNLGRANVADAERAAKDPTAQRVLAEVAMIVTLKQNGMELSPDFLKIFMAETSTFKPKFPQIAN